MTDTNSATMDSLCSAQLAMRGAENGSHHLACDYVCRRLRQICEYHDRELGRRIALNAAAKSLPRTIKLEHRVPAQLRMVPTETVVADLTIGSADAPPERIVRNRGQQRAPIERCDPGAPVIQRQVETAVGRRIERRGDEVLVANTNIGADVAGSAIVYNGAVADHARGPHAERPEYLAGQKIAVEGSRHPRDDDAGEDVTHVVVLPLAADREVERKGLRNMDNLVIGVFAPEVEHLTPVLGVADAGGVAQKMAYGNPFPARRTAWKIFVDPVVKRQLAAFGEQQHGGGGELLAERTRLEHCPALDRDPMLDIGHAVGADACVLAVAHDEQRDAGDMVAALRRGYDVVDGIRPRRRCAQRHEKKDAARPVHTAHFS